MPLQPGTLDHSRELRGRGPTYYRLELLIPVPILLVSGGKLGACPYVPFLLSQKTHAAAAQPHNLV